MAALKEALPGEIATNDPPETGLTLARLQREGMSEDEALRWRSAVLLQEMSIMIRAMLDRLRGC